MKKLESRVIEIELHPAVSLLEETFNLLIAPAELLAEVLNGHQSLQRYEILCICGNYSSILSRLDRNIAELEIRGPSPPSNSWPSWKRTTTVS
jgi:hypothetical protein